MKLRLFLMFITATILWAETSCAPDPQANTNASENKKSLCGKSSRRRFGDETKANVYYFCNKNDGKWSMYSFTCPKNTYFVDHLEKCSTLEFMSISPITTPAREKEHDKLSYSTTRPYVIHSWSESLQEIQNLINNGHVSRVSTTKKPSSVTTTSEDPWKSFFQHGLTLSPPKPVSYGGSSLISSAEIPSLSTTTPSNLQKTKINSLSSVQVSTEELKVTTEPTTTTVPLSKQDELVVRDFIIKNTKPLIPFPGSDHYIWSRPLVPSVSDKIPLRLPLPELLSLQLPSGKAKPKLKVKLPMPNPTNGFSVQLLEKFGVKLIPEDQFFFKRKPILHNFTTTVYSSPEDTTLYDPSLILSNPINLANHLQSLPLPSSWFSEKGSSRDRNKDPTKANHFNDDKSSSRKPRI